ncbi:GNAT family N-acetyltransferase [Hymenobacter sp. B1770]|uniref:GNAT family N-acetyltransferase n=1 Tax=Hymenobacter sp. B1770 TaxID=1718788 RepID=UPI003CF428EE
MTMPTLRTATLADLDILLPQMANFYAHFGYPYHPATQRTVVADFLAHPAWGELFLIEEAEQLVGYVALTYGFSFELRGRFGLVDELYVSAAARSRGVGRAALQFLQQQTRAAGLVALHLQTEPGNTRAQQLYESLGFADDGRRNLTWHCDAAPALPPVGLPE